MHPLAKLDQRFLWHPFTQMRDWLAQEPTVIVSGKGATLRDVRGRQYLDANSSIWTNLHGHAHPAVNRAIEAQLAKIAHSSALGLANEPATYLGKRLVEAAAQTQSGLARPPKLNKVFFSDDGSTATEVALKLAYEFARRTTGTRSPRFLSLAGAYHGDTVGAVSLGHIDLFHKAYGGLLFRSDQVMAPYCYRCPFNRAKPQRADAREYRKCRWECIDKVEARLAAQARRGNPYAAMVVEPLIQGAAGMIAHPRGWLRRTSELVRAFGAQLIADEVLTGFGRTTAPRPEAGPSSNARTAKRSPAPAEPARDRDPATPSDGDLLFACQKEEVVPDFLVLAKGLTGGYLPMGATLTTQNVFDAFLGEYQEFKTFFHGHSYTANQLGAAAGLASLDLLQAPAHARRRENLAAKLQEELAHLWRLPAVGDIRQVGLIAGIELVRDSRTRTPYELRERVGIRVCEAMARRGVLTRPVGSVIVLIPPYCTTHTQIERTVQVLGEAIEETLRVK